MVIFNSCLGTVDNSGTLIPALPHATNEEFVSGAAIIRANKGATPDWSTSNQILRFEPTWGDVDVLTRVLRKLQPRNSTQLLAAFSSGASSAKALQKIRNGAAHVNPQTMIELDSLRSTYLVFPINHPTHALFWVSPNSGDFLIADAIDDLKDVGMTAIS